MSGSTSNKVESVLERMKQTSSGYIIKARSIWSVMYGPDDANLERRLETLEAIHEEFWKERIADIEKEQAKIVDNIESMGMQALNIEKALGMKSGLANLADLPLAELEEHVLKLLRTYQELKAKRVREFSDIQQRERVLCDVLDQDCQLADTNQLATERSPNVPNNEDMTQAKERLAYLEFLKEQLENTFTSAKIELCQILDDCELLPLSIAERFACSENGLVQFDCNKKNYDLMVADLEKYKTMKAKAASKADQLRDQISTLWMKMLKDKEPLDEFLVEHKGFRKSTIVKLERNLSALQAERRDNLKELILQQRSLLDNLWTECKFTDDQRSEFQAYNSNYFTENILEEHELQVDRLKEHLAKHKHIYNSAEKYFDYWEKMLHLEDLAKRSDRLFKNRGGQLLQEEKERKSVQKKLPAIKSKLINLLLTYREEEEMDFLYLGRSLLDTLEEMEEQRQASKENDKLQRKAAVDCKTETPRPTPTSSRKRKITPPTNQNAQRNAVSNERRRRLAVETTFTVPSTPAKTPTPHSSSPTYESFQENLVTVCKEEYLQSSTMDLAAPTTSRSRLMKTPSKTQFKTNNQLKTPTKTPSKIPFRVATGNTKIPSVPPPMGTRSSSKNRSRTKLPIIF